MPNLPILDKIPLLRALIEDSEMDPEDKLLAEDLLREIEEEARK